MLAGKFVVIEGGEGVGKSTLIENLKNPDLLVQDSVLFTREPGGTPIGKELRRLLLGQNEWGGLTKESELMLFAADRLEHVSKVIAPALADGKLVICDRFIPSSYAYQIGAAGGGEKLKTLFEVLHRPILEIAKPDLYIMLDLPVEKAFDRMRVSAKTLDSFETRDRGFHEKVRFTMRSFIENSGVEHLLVDSDVPPKELATRIMSRICFRIGRYDG